MGISSRRCGAVRRDGEGRGRGWAVGDRREGEARIEARTEARGGKRKTAMEMDDLLEVRRNDLSRASGRCASRQVHP